MQPNTDNPQQTRSGALALKPAYLEPDGPEAMMHDFAEEIRIHANGQLSPKDNPGLITMLAAERVDMIKAIVKRAGTEHNRELAQPYRSLYALFSTIQGLGQQNRFRDLSTLLNLAAFEGHSDDELDKAVRHDLKDDPEKLALYEAKRKDVSPDMLRIFLLRKAFERNHALRDDIHDNIYWFDQLMEEHGLLNPLEDLWRAGDNQTGTTGADIIRTAKYLAARSGLTTALLIASNLVAPAFGLGATTYPDIASAIVVSDNNVALSDKQFNRLLNGMRQITSIMDELDKTIGLRNTAAQVG